MCKDPRKHRIQHELTDIIVVVVLGTLCGEEGWEGFVDWAYSKEPFLRTFLPLKNGIPCPDTLRRVIERLNPESFLQAFIAWATEVSKRFPGQICIDGKTLAGTIHEGGALHLVSAWCEVNQMVLGSVSAGSEKGKEIPAIKELLDTLILREGDVITIDAIGCQRDIVSKIIDQGADYVIALKKNQSMLWEEVNNYFSQAYEAREYAPCEIHSYDEERSRKDVHEVWVTDELDWLTGAEKWVGLKSFVMVRRNWVEKDKEKSEIRYYISSLQESSEKLARLVRRHWSIENEYHWHLDVTFNEDDSQISQEANKNLRIARDIALKILRGEKTFKRGLKSKMRQCLRSEAYLHKVLLSGNF